MKVRQSYAEITATQRRLLKQKEQADAMAEDWYNRAQLALNKGKESLAKEALMRRQAELETAKGLQYQIDTQTVAIDKLYEGMRQLESKLMDSKAKKERMIARARTAKSTQEVNDMLNGLASTGKSSGMDAFRRMEDKVEALEAAAEVSAEMGSIRRLDGSSIEQEFRMLEASSSVDDELKKMKGRLMLETSSSSSINGSTSTDNFKEVDKELAQLKKKAGL